MKDLKDSHKDVFQIWLYIPHGSDERLAWRSIFLSFFSFISHMVQMKEKIDS